MRLQRIHQPLLIRHDGKQLQHQILGVQLRREKVLHRLRLARGDGDVVPRRREVPHDPLLRAFLRAAGWRVQAAADERDADVRGFVVGEGEQGLRRLAVDELDAEDFGLREGGRDLDVEVGRRLGEVEAWGVFVGGGLGGVFLVSSVGRMRELGRGLVFTSGGRAG